MFDNVKKLAESLENLNVDCSDLKGEYQNPEKIEWYLSRCKTAFDEDCPEVALAYLDRLLRVKDCDLMTRSVIIAKCNVMYDDYCLRRN